MRAMLTALLALVAFAPLAGCEREMRDMYAQPRLGPDAGSPLFADGRGTRAPPPDSVPYAMGELAMTSGGRRGRDEVAAREAAEAASGPPASTAALLARGRERFDIECAACHSPTGDGDGLVVRRGFPRPPDLHAPRLVGVPDRHLYDVIAHGYGVMPSHGDRVTPADRWAIVAYVRTLQRSEPAPATPGSPPPPATPERP
jgi:mono/diheme cytochrome c family protein